MVTELPADRAFKAGHFTEALALVESTATPTLSHRALRCESLQMIGRSDEARNLAEKLLDDSSATPSERSRFAAVVASQAYEVGNLPESLQWWHRALQTAEESGDSELVSKCAGQVLERTCDRVGFDSSLPLASRARRAAARSGTAITIQHCVILLSAAHSCRQRPTSGYQPPWTWTSRQF
jgi:hypothetical protein